MANIKFGNGWADARGKVGGVIYSKNKSGSYARNWVKPTNPRTPAQVAARNRFSYVTTNWRMLSDPERNSWNYAASQFTTRNKLGEEIKLSGSQYFNKQNMGILAAGGTTIVTTPGQLIDIVGAVSLVVTATVTAGVVTGMAMSAVLVDGTTVIPADHFAVIRATPRLSNGITRPQPSAYTVIDELQPAATLTSVAILPAYEDNLGTLEPDGNVWVSIEIYNGETGQRSQTLEAKVSYVTAP